MVKLIMCKPSDKKTRLQKERTLIELKLISFDSSDNSIMSTITLDLVLMNESKQTESIITDYETTHQMII